MDEISLRVVQNPGTIELNFEELNRQMDAKLAEYKGTVFTEETKDIGKRELASLRALKKDVEDARKAAKKEWMKPFESFENQMKLLSGKVDEPINLIDGQLKEFEANRKAEKKKKITEAYEELIGDMKEYLPLDRIYDLKWENTTVTMKSIKESIGALARSTSDAVLTIQGMQSDAVEKALGIYKDTLDMAKAISHINDYERQKAEIMKREEERRRAEEERKRREEEERARKAEAADAETACTSDQAEEQDEEAFSVSSEFVKNHENPYFEALEDPEDDEPFFSCRNDRKKVKATYDVFATPEDLSSLETFMERFGMKFERRDSR